MLTLLLPNNDISLHMRWYIRYSIFHDKTTVENNATSVLKAIPKSEFQDCFEKWKYRWNRVPQSSGDYFERCHLPDDEESRERGDIKVGPILSRQTSYIEYLSKGRYKSYLQL